MTDSSSSVDVNTQCQVRHLVDSLQISTREELERGSKMRNNFQFGMLVKDWKGWWADLYYYSANVHPLHGIWACCHNNRLDRSDRIMMEVAAICFCLWMEHERTHLVNTVGRDDLHWLYSYDRIFRMVCITMPSCVIYFLLIILFTTPVIGTIDESSAHRPGIVRARAFSIAGDFAGNFFSLGILLCTIIRLGVVNSATPVSVTIIFMTVYARASAYLLNWGLVFGVYFNPFIALGSTEHGQNSLLLKLVDLVGLGQWHMERCKVLLTTLILPEKQVNLLRSISSISVVSGQPGLDGVDASDGMSDGILKTALEGVDVKLKVNEDAELGPLKTHTHQTTHKVVVWL